jgi:hypothetical protein
MYQAVTILALAVIDVVARDTKLVMVLARHGARYPIAAGIDERRKGEITENGLRMCYLLGKFIRIKYADFFPAKFNYNRNYVLASGLPRTQMSAQSLMLGIYDFNSLTDPLKVDRKYYTPEWEGFDIVDDLITPLPEGFQPIPVHSYQPEENFAFESFNFDLCPKVKAFTLADTDSQGQELLGYLNLVLVDLKNEGFDYKDILGTDTLENVMYFYILADYIIASRYTGKVDNISDKLFDKIYLLYSMTLNYIFFREQNHAKYFISELAALMVAQFEGAKAALDKGDDHFNQFVLFHGHDINLMNVLSLVGLSSYECLKNLYLGKSDSNECMKSPPYSSSFIFEMYNEDAKLFVDTLYNGEQVGFCTNQKNEKCTYEDFIARLKSFVLPDDIPTLRQTYCYEPEVSKNWMMTAILIFNVGVIVVLSGLIYKYKKKVEYASE